MNKSPLSLDEIRRRVIAALARELGSAGMIRFLQQFETGTEDYMSDRNQWLPADVQAVIDEIAHNRAGQSAG